MNWQRGLVGSAIGLVLGSAPVKSNRSNGEDIDRVATMGTPRAAHTASVLPTGAVVLIGGMGSDEGSLATAEMFDPSSRKVVEVGTMASRRAGHTATVLPDGRIVVTGGYDGSYLRSVEVFDPATRRFASLGQLAVGRSDHTATLLPEGTILLIGGVGDGYSFLASAEVFDPATGRSELAGSMAVARESHTATMLPNGSILVIGGHRGRRADMEVFRSTEIYHPAARRFSPDSPLDTPRHKHAAVTLADGRVLVLGGADRTDRRYFATTEIYDPETGTFGPGPSMQNTRYKFEGTAVRLPNGDVLVAGGARSAEVLDHSSLHFRLVGGDFPDPLSFATASLLPSGEVVVVGGYSPSNRVADGIWRFRE